MSKTVKERSKPSTPTPTSASRTSPKSKGKGSKTRLANPKTSDDDRPNARDADMTISPVAFNGVRDMLRATLDPEDSAEIIARLDARNLGQALMIARMMRQITQAEMAEKLGCTQSKVSKLERGRDVDHLLGDLVAFAGAVGKRIRLVLEDGEGLAVEVQGRPEATGRKRVARKGVQG
jgi:predicted XRE-type DNA-binding protein